MTASILRELARITDFSLDLPRLSLEERLAVMQSLIDANAPSGREAIWRKFLKFARMCTARGWRALPASPEQLYAYVLFLKAEGRVSVDSAGGYLSAISTVHAWAGLAGGCAHDAVTARLLRAWRVAAPPQAYRESILAFPAVDLFRLAARALEESNPYRVRPFVSLILDTLFFSRADSGFNVLLDDLWLGSPSGDSASPAPTHLFFRERHHKSKSTRALLWRIRAFDCRGFPALPRLLRHWRRIRDACRARHLPGRRGHEEFFYGLPSDAHPPSARAVQSWFLEAARHLTSVGSDYHHHCVRRTGASSAFSILVPEAQVRSWGWWAPGSAALWKYVDLQRQPTEYDFRLFGWMLVEADSLRHEIRDIFYEPSPPAVGAP